jgi:hypothetical protein
MFRPASPHAQVVPGPGLRRRSKRDRTSARSTAQPWVWRTRASRPPATGASWLRPQESPRDTSRAVMRSRPGSTTVILLLHPDEPEGGRRATENLPAHATETDPLPIRAGSSSLRGAPFFRPRCCWQARMPRPDRSGPRVAPTRRDPISSVRRDHRPGLGVRGSDLIFDRTQVPHAPPAPYLERALERGPHWLRMRSGAARPELPPPAEWRRRPTVAQLNISPSTHGT